MRGETKEFPWYHTFELPDGTLIEGLFDHRPLIPHYGIPEDLEGKRVLDVATADGFWAFEFERRGAEVVATDIPQFIDGDIPPLVKSELQRGDVNLRLGTGFEKMKKALGSHVERRFLNIYDLSPETIGVFDLVHSADVLLHLENPIAALRAIRSVTSGRALIVDVFDPQISENREQLTRYHGGWDDATLWWTPSLHALGQMVVDAGFAEVEVRKVYQLPGGHGPWRSVLVASTA